MGCRKNSPARRSTFTNEMFVFHFLKIAPSHHVARLLVFFDISIDKRDATTFTFAHPKTKETGLLRNSRDQVKIYVLFKKKEKWIERLTWLLSTSMIIGSAFYDDERSFSLVFFFSLFPAANKQCASVAIEPKPRRSWRRASGRDGEQTQFVMNDLSRFSFFSFSKQSLTVSTEMAAANAQPFFVFTGFIYK